MCVSTLVVTEKLRQNTLKFFSFSQYLNFDFFCIYVVFVNNEHTRVSEADGYEYDNDQRSRI